MKHFRGNTKKAKVKLKEDNEINKLIIAKHQTQFFFIGNMKWMLKLSWEELALFPKYQYVQPQPFKSILLPSWVDIQTLKTYISYSKGFNMNLDERKGKNLIDLANFFQNDKLIQMIINETIQPYINKENCLSILIENYKKIETKSNTLCEGYSRLINTCIELTANNLFHLIKVNEKELNSLKKRLTEEIIDRFFYLRKESEQDDYTPIINFLIKNKKFNDVFELLESRRKDTIKRSILYVPVIVWKINIPENQSSFYKESNDFSIENINNILIVYYDAETDNLKVALRTGNSVDKICKTEHRNDDYNKRQIESFRIYSFLSLVEIPKINYKSIISFNCLFNTSNSKILLSKIDNFSKFLKGNNIINRDLKELTLKVYIEYDFCFSAVLMHICKNFHLYHSLSSISIIPKNLLTIILKSRNLNINNEDEKLIGIVNYIKTSHEQNFSDLFNLINMSEIILQTIIELFIYNSNLISKNSMLKDIIIKEFNRRFERQYLNEKESSFCEELIEKLSDVSSRCKLFPREIEKGSKNNVKCFRNDSLESTNTQETKVESKNNLNCVPTLLSNHSNCINKSPNILNNERMNNNSKFDHIYDHKLTNLINKKTFVGHKELIYSSNSNKRKNESLFNNLKNSILIEKSVSRSNFKSKLDFVDFVSSSQKETSKKLTKIIKPSMKVYTQNHEIKMINYFNIPSKKNC